MKRAIAFSFIAALFATGCLTRSVKEEVYEQDLTRVLLRSQRKGSETLAKGFAQPLAISPARMAHILSRIDLRKGASDDERNPAIPLKLLYVIADGMSQAFAKANPDQEIVVMAIERGKHWGVFDRRYLTSLVAFVREDLLYIHVGRSAWEIPAARDADLPEPAIDEPMTSYRLVPSEGMTLANPQTVAVVWRDPIFQRPSRTRILRDGKIVRREVLMESPDESIAAPVASDVLPANLAPETLRKLADLEDQKKLGEVTQTQYEALRASIVAADPSVSE